MRIGIVSDGKYGDRAYDNIKKKFQAEWLLIDFPDSPLLDDVELNLPPCDLYISYVRHPDVVLELLGKKIPTILGISFGLGFLRQAKEINEHVIAPITICSLEDDTGVKEIDEYAKFYGRPKFKPKLTDGRIDYIQVLRESPCGSTRGAVSDIVGRQFTKETLQFFALRVCHYCRAPRFGKTCDKEFSGMLHIRELTHAVLEYASEAQKSIGHFAKEIEEAYEKRAAKKTIL